MFSLVETLTGFAAIMLMLSLLVKTLTSVIKNQWDYYSDNLKHEVERLTLETTGKTWEALIRNPAAPMWVKNIHWERLGDEFLTPAYMSWFLKQLDSNARVFDLETRLKIHVANVKYTFEMRMKNLALAVGLAICLLCNINAFTIWRTLYTDQQMRATFANSYADAATKLAAVQPKDSTNTPEQREANIKSFQDSMRGFLKDVRFGIGRVWQPSLTNDEKDPDHRSTSQVFVYEFFGSLLTGILVSIGAPYWHDILQALSSLRPDKAKA